MSPAGHPTARTVRLVRWVVVNDPAKVRQMAEMTIDWMKIVKEKKPELYAEANLEVFVDAWDGGEDRISRGAPCVIVACAPKDERTAPPAAMIAIAYVQVAAAGLGLGATFTGSINTAAQSYPPLIELLDLPDGHVPYRNLRPRLPGGALPSNSHQKASRGELALKAASDREDAIPERSRWSSRNGATLR